MTPVEPSIKLKSNEWAITFAKDQPEYIPLPAIINVEGVVTTEWDLTEEERERLIKGERIKLKIWTMGEPLQPIMLEVTSEND